jgi:hypothetical protein
MARLIEKIIKDAPTERRKMHVPEWQGEALPDGDVYFKPRTKAVMEAALPTGDAEISHAMIGLYLLVATAEDVNGARIFEVRDIDGLREKADLAILTRVEAFMWGTQLPSPKEAEAAIQADPTSASS